MAMKCDAIARKFVELPRFMQGQNVKATNQLQIQVFLPEGTMLVLEEKWGRAENS